MMNFDFIKILAARRDIDKVLEDMSFDEKIGLLSAEIDICIADAGKKHSEVWSKLYENSKLVNLIFGRD